MFIITSICILNKGFDADGIAANATMTYSEPPESIEKPTRTKQGYKKHPQGTGFSELTFKF